MTHVKRATFESQEPNLFGLNLIVSVQPNDVMIRWPSWMGPEESSASGLEETGVIGQVNEKRFDVQIKNSFE